MGWRESFWQGKAIWDGSPFAWLSSFPGDRLGWRFSSISLRKLQSITSVLRASRWPLLKRLVSKPIHSEMKFSNRAGDCMKLLLPWESPRGLTKGILWRTGKEPSPQWHRIYFLFSSSPIPPLILLASLSPLTGLLFAGFCLFSRQCFKLKSSNDLGFPPSTESELYDNALSFNPKAVTLCHPFKGHFLFFSINPSCLSGFWTLVWPIFSPSIISQLSASWEKKENKSFVFRA